MHRVPLSTIYAEVVASTMARSRRPSAPFPQREVVTASRAGVTGIMPGISTPCGVSRIIQARVDTDYVAANDAAAASSRRTAGAAVHETTIRLDQNGKYRGEYAIRARGIIKRALQHRI